MCSKLLKIISNKSTILKHGEMVLGSGFLLSE